MNFLKTFCFIDQKAADVHKNDEQKAEQSCSKLRKNAISPNELTPKISYVLSSETTNLNF